MSELSFSSVVFGVVLTWGLGLAEPALLRFWLLKRPLPWWGAVAATFIFYVVNISILRALGGTSHGAYLMVTIFSYAILVRPNQASPISGADEVSEMRRKKSASDWDVKK